MSWLSDFVSGRSSAEASSAAKRKADKEAKANSKAASKASKNASKVAKQQAALLAAQTAAWQKDSARMQRNFDKQLSLVEKGIKDSLSAMKADETRMPQEMDPAIKMAAERFRKRTSARGGRASTILTA